MPINLISQNNKIRNLLEVLADIISCINPFSGSTSSTNGKSGLVPAPQISDRTKFLRGDGTWQFVSSGSGGGLSTEEVEAMLEDYASTAYVDGQLASCLPLSGGNVTGSLTVNNGSIAMSSDLASYLPLSGGNVTGSLTVQGKDVDAIDSKGTGYIRYANGIQMCWGQVEGTTSDPTFTFPMPFNAVPSLSLTLNESISRATSVVAKTLTATNFSVSIYSNSHTSGTVLYIAIGTWK